MLEGLVINFCILAGLGAWFSWAGLGGAFFLGGILIPLGLFLGNSAFGLPLEWCNWVLVAIAVAGALRALIYRENWRATSWPLIVLHPMIFLPALVFVIAVAQDDLSYLPLNFDELASWAAWCKQVFVADIWWREDMLGSIRIYPKGWPMAAAFAQWPFQSFEELRAIALLGLFHISILAMLFDALRMAFERRGDLEKRQSFVLAWIVILLLLAGEASWKLLPPSFLVERPILYWAVGLFTLALFAWHDEKNGSKAIACMGLVVASVITIKSPMTNLMLPAAFFGLLHWWKTERGGSVLRQALALGTVLAVVLVPGVFVIVAHSFVSPDYGPAGSNGILETQPWKIGPLSTAILSSLNAYVGSYKFPMTIVSLIGLASGFCKPELRPMALGLVLFVVSYWLGLWSFFLFVSSGTGNEALPSLQRYARLPLRLMHVFGPALLAINVADYVIRKKRTLIDRLWNKKPVIGAMTALVIGLVLFQVWGLDRTFLSMRGRPLENQKNVSDIKRLKAEGAKLIALFDQAGMISPLVAIVYQGDSGIRHKIAHYYGLGNDRGGQVHRYRMLGAWSWGETPVNVWMEKTDREGFLETMMSVDVIWPIRLDDWTQSAIGTFSDTPECGKRLTDHFLIKTAAEEFRCIEKSP